MEIGGATHHRFGHKIQLSFRETTKFSSTSYPTDYFKQIVVWRKDN